MPFAAPRAALAAAVGRDGPVDLGGLPPIRWSGAGAPADVGAAFRASPAGKLVVVGAAHTGKTTLLRVLAAQLLAGAPPAPVPIRVDLTGWEPERRGFADWLAGWVAAALEPGEETGGPDRYPLAEELVREGAVLPLVDGLDRLPARAGAAAVVSLDEYATDRPLVLACREDAYRRLATEGAVLPGATVIRLHRLRLTDAAGLLAEPARPGQWRPDRDASAYTPPGARAPGDPPPPAATDRPAARWGLFDRYVWGSYVDRGARRAEDLRYLGFLAGRRGDAGPAELGWWRWISDVPRWVAVLIYAGLAAVSFEAVLWPTYTVCQWLRPGLFAGMVDLLSVAIQRRALLDVVHLAQPTSRGGHLWWLGALMLIGGSLGLLGAPDEDKPRRPVGQARWSWADARWGVRRMVTRAIFTGALVGLSHHFRFPASMWEQAADERFWLTRADSGPPASLVSALAVAAAVLLYGALSGGWRARPEELVPLREQPPEQTLRAARHTALGTAAAVTAIVGLSSVVIGGADALAPTHVLSAPGWFPLLVLGLMVGLGVGLWSALAQVWGRYTVARIYLALRGRLPWRPIRFLHDAQRRGLLERDGSVFAFRHELVREMLTGDKSPP